MCGSEGYEDTKKLKRTGEMHEPCGTPVCTCLCGEEALLKRQLAIRPLRYADSQRVVL